MMASGLEVELPRPARKPFSALIPALKQSRKLTQTVFSQTSHRKDLKLPVKIDELLRVATNHGASDLHLKVGAFPAMRIGGELHTVGDAPRLKPEDTLDMAVTIMSHRQTQRFKEQP